VKNSGREKILEKNRKIKIQKGKRRNDLSLLTIDDDCYSLLIKNEKEKRTLRI